MLLLLFLREMLHNMLILFIRLVEMIKIKELIDKYTTFVVFAEGEGEVEGDMGSRLAIFILGIMPRTTTLTK